MEIRVFPQLLWVQQQLRNPANQALVEVTAALAVNLTLGMAVASSAPLSMGLGVTAVALAAWRPQESRFLHAARLVARFSMIHLASTATVTPLIHESGHALMALAFFKNPGVRIHYKGFFAGATTTYAVSYGLTTLGRCFGKEGSIALVTAGGMAASTLWAIAVAKVCRLLAISQIYHEATYALQALRISMDWTHDYVRLWTAYGIHPLIPVTGMVSLLAIRLMAL